MLNEGFSGPGIACRTPGLPSMVGVAVTLKVRTADPTMRRGFYLEHSDWWEHLGEANFPRVLVIEDVDSHPGRGTLVGPVHACILQAMGFTGIVTTGPSGEPGGSPRSACTRFPGTSLRPTPTAT